jgi:AraC family transcriptional regulator
VTDYIRKNLRGDLSGDKLAEVAGYECKYHFSRLFKQATGGVTLHQWVIRIRVEQAEHRMLRGDQTLAEIAWEVGFADQSHLTRHFGRIIGVTPNKLLM